MSFSIGKCPLHVQKTRNSRKNLRIAADAMRAGDNTLLRAGKKAGMHEKKEHNMVSKQTRADRMRRVFVKSMVFSLAVAAMASLPLFSPASAAAAELAGKKPSLSIILGAATPGRSPNRSSKPYRLTPWN